MEIKIKTLITILFSVVISLFLYFVLNIGLSILLVGSIFVVSFIILCIFIGKIEIRLADYIYHIVLFCCFGFSFFIINSNFALKLDLYNWEKNILKEKVLQENIEYTLKDRYIYNSDEEKILKFTELNSIEKGYIELSNNKLFYKISFSNNKCVIKDKSGNYTIT